MLTNYLVSVLSIKACAVQTPPAAGAELVSVAQPESGLSGSHFAESDVFVTVKTV